MMCTRKLHSNFQIRISEKQGAKRRMRSNARPLRFSEQQQQRRRCKISIQVSIRLIHLSSVAATHYRLRLRPPFSFNGSSSGSDESPETLCDGRPKQYDPSWKCSDRTRNANRDRDRVNEQNRRNGNLSTTFDIHHQFNHRAKPAWEQTTSHHNRYSTQTTTKPDFSSKASSHNKKAGP